MNSTCTCHNESLDKTITCFNCKATWLEKMPHHERVASCKEHCHMIAICGGSRPSLCHPCINNGYTVESEGGGWFPKYVVVKK